MIKSWSWSRYADYRQCPRKAKYKHVMRMKEPGSKALSKGSAYHDLLSQYILGSIKTFPKMLEYEFENQKFKEPFENRKFAMDQAKPLRALYTKRPDDMMVEDDWAFTKGWERCRWDDWDRCWVRLKLDVAHIATKKAAVITDWKTGRAREEEHVYYTQQLQLYALAALLIIPGIEVVYPRLVFVDAGKVFPESREDLTYVPQQVEELKLLWADRTKPMLHDTIFAANPSNKCRWCHYRKANSGPCEF